MICVTTYPFVGLGKTGILRNTCLLAILTLRPVFNAVTVASVFTILLLMDQPLFQRGIRTVTRSSEEATSMTIPISLSPLQKGATAILPAHDSSDDSPQVFHPLFAQVVRQYQNRDPIHFALRDCKGRCDFDVISTGWEVDCHERETPYRMMDWLDWNEYAWGGVHGIQYTGPLQQQPAFSVNITYHPGFEDMGPGDFGSFHINTSVMHKATTGPNGTMHWRSCILTEALIKYPVEISNNTLRLRSMAPDNNRTIYKILRRAEYTDDIGTCDGFTPYKAVADALTFKTASQRSVVSGGQWNTSSLHSPPSLTSLN
jgi:hypothetical protein